MSCSDKLARWTALGLQGGGLVGLAGDGPLRIQQLVVGCPAGQPEAATATMEAAVRHAVAGRAAGLPSLLLIRTPMARFNVV